MVDFYSKALSSDPIIDNDETNVDEIPEFIIRQRLGEYYSVPLVKAPSFRGSLDIPFSSEVRASENRPL